MIQWLRLPALNIGSTGLIPGLGNTGSHMLQLRNAETKKILHATMEDLVQSNKYININ